MDAKDKVVLGLVCFIVLATWGYVYIHPDPGVIAYGIAVTGSGTIGGILHWLWIRDDKTPDRRGDNGTPPQA